MTEFNKNLHETKVPAPQTILHSPDYFKTSASETNTDLSSVAVLENGWVFASKSTSSHIVVISPQGQMKSLEEIFPNIRTSFTCRKIIQLALVALKTSDRNFIGTEAFVKQFGGVNLNKIIAQFVPGLDASKDREEIQKLAVKILQQTSLSQKKTVDSWFLSPSDLKDHHIGMVSDEQLIKRPTTVMSVDGNIVTLEIMGEAVALAVDGPDLKNWKKSPSEVLPLFKNKTGIYAVSDGQTITRIYNKNESGFERQIRALSDPRPVLDPSDGDTVYFTENGKLHKFSLTGMESGFLNSETIDLLDVDNIQQVIMDPRGNFLIVKHGDNQLTIFDKKSRTKHYAFAGIKSNVGADKAGNLYFVDDNNQLRIITTNFAQFDPEQMSRMLEEQRQKMKALLSEIEQLDIDNIVANDLEEKVTALQRKQEKTVSNDDIKEALKVKLEGEFLPLVQSATDEQALLKLEAKLSVLRKKDPYQQYPEAFATVQQAFERRRNEFKAKVLVEAVEDLEQRVRLATTIEQSIAVAQRLEEVRQMRQSANLQVLEGDLRNKVQTSLEHSSERIVELQKEFQGQLVTSLEGMLSEMEAAIQPALSINELSELEKDPVVERFNSRLNLVTDAKERRRLRVAWGEIRQKKRSEIQTKTDERKREQEARVEEVVREIAEALRELQEDIDAVLGETEGRINLEAWAFNHPRSERVRQLINHLPESRRADYDQQYLSLLRERVQRFEQEKEATKTIEREKVRVLAGEAFPTFRDRQILFSPGWVTPIVWGTDGKKIDFSKLTADQRAEYKGELAFESQNAGIWRSGVYMNMRVDDSDPRYQKAKARAETHFNPKREVPPLSRELRMTEYTLEVLGNMARNLRAQLGLDKQLNRVRTPRGLLIMQGDAGVGKDFNIDAFGALTNYEVVNIPCRKTMDPEDLTSEFRFDPKKGTYRVPAKFAEALSKPGVIINLIEINAMPAEVTKMLNSVFDYRRTLYFTQGEDPDYVELNTNGIGQKIEVHPDNLLIGTMNPENYIGTQPLAQEFKSRARVIEVDYQPYNVIEKVNGEYERVNVETQTVPSGKSTEGFTKVRKRPDEAFILAQRAEDLRTLNKEEFTKLWNHAVNGDAVNGGDIFATPERLQAISALDLLVRIANKVRQAYRAYQRNESNDIVEFVFTQRETEEIIFDLEEFDQKSVKNAVKLVVLPKIGEYEQRQRVEQLIDAA